MADEYDTVTYEVTFKQTVDPDTLETVGYPTDCVDGQLVQYFEFVENEIASEVEVGEQAPRAIEVWTYDVFEVDTDRFEQVLDECTDVLSYKQRGGSLSDVSK